MKNILITGAGGLLGGELIKELLHTPHNVYALTSNKEKLEKEFGDKVIVYQNEDLFAGNMPIEGITLIVHCAFSRSQDGQDIANSLKFTRDVFFSAAINNCDIINISSRSIYDQNPNTPWTESTAIRPDTLYAMAKLTSELLAETTSNNKINFTNIRLAGLLAPSFDSRIVNKFIDNAIQKRYIKITGGKQQFAFLDIRDAVAGIIALIHSQSKNWAPIYNLGYLKSYSITEIAETVKKVAAEYNIDVTIVIESSDAMLHAELDSSLFYKDTNWTPKYDMEAIVKSIFKYKIK